MDNRWARLGAAAEQNIAMGRYSEAVAQLREATALNPEHADSWFNLGYVLRQLRAYEDALAAYEAALQRGIEAAEAAHVNRALILSEYLDRHIEAEQELRNALALNPSFIPAWLNLGGVYEDAGNADGAADAYRHALAVAPGNGRARARLAAIQVHQGRIDTAIADLSDRLHRGADSPDDEAELLFALGNTLDEARRYNDAFAAIARANAINFAQRAPSRRYDARAQERLVDALIATFPARPARAAIASDDHVIFICGLFRSGSTVIEQLLGHHPQITAGGELELIPALVHEKLMPYPAALDRLTEAHVRALGDSYRTAITTAFPGARHVTDKRPDNFIHIGLIKTLFPGARIIHTRRHLLDNLISIFFLNFAETITYSDRIDDIVHYMTQYRRLMIHWERIFGDDIVAVDYDRLVIEPDAVLSATFASLDLPASAGTDTDRPGKSIIRTPSNWKARSALNARSSGRWNHYAAQMEAVRTTLARAGISCLAS